MTSPEGASPHAVASSTPGPLAIGASLAGVALYLVFVHWLLVTGAMPMLSLAVIVAPWAVALVSTLWSDGASGPRGPRRVAATAVVAVLALVAWRGGDRLAAQADGVLYLENLAFLATLAGAFGLSLRPGREALVTRFARITRDDDLPPPVVRYTRAITLAWSLFFVAAAVGSTFLFFTQSRTVWSSFVNLALGPLVVAAFVLEYFVRLRVLRGMTHGTFMTGVMAFRHRDPVDARGGS